MAMGSGCGSVGRAGASNTKDPRFESYLPLTVEITVEKTKIGRAWPIFLNVDGLI